MYREKLSVGGEEVMIGAMCPNETEKYGLKTWSLRGLQSREDAEKQVPLITGLRATLQRMGVHRGYAPNVIAFSARVVDTAVLKERIKLGENIDLYRSRLPADGVFIRRGHAFVMSSAGCPIIIAVAGELMVVAHAGRDSLVDRGAVRGVSARKHVSVVDAIVEEFAERGILPDRISMCMIFAIPASVFEHRFGHRTYGRYNRALWSFIVERWPSGAISQNGSMFLNLENLFEEQTRQAGIKDVRMTNSLAEFPALAHTHDGGDTSRRNLFVVKRCS